MSSFEIVNDVVISSTKQPNASGPTTLNCDIYTKPDYETAMSIICIVTCIFGILYTFFGYRCFKVIMFLSGLLFGGSVVYIICQEKRIFHQQLKLEIIIGISVGIGILCGFITMLIRYVGLFLQGFFFGVLLAIAGIVALQKFYHPSTPWIPVGILFGTGVLFAVLTLKWQKTFVIISTATMGGGLIVICVEYFVEKLILLRYIWEGLMAAATEPICWYTWIVFSMWPLLTVIGAVIQWKITGKGYDHTDVVIWQGQRKRVRTHLVRQRNQTPATREARQQREAGQAQQEPARNSQRTQREGRRARQSSGSRQSSQTRRANERPTASSSGRNIQPTSSTNDQFNTDTLPPSYFDCVEKGIGKPVKAEDRGKIVRTHQGSFLMQSDEVTCAQSSASQRDNRTRLPNVSSRNPSNRQRRTNESQRSSNTSANPQNRPPERRSGRNRSPGWSQALRSRQDDQQSLLSEGSQRSNVAQQYRTRNRDAMVAHARRLQEAENRRSNISNT